MNSEDCAQSASPSIDTESDANQEGISEAPSEIECSHERKHWSASCGVCILLSVESNFLLLAG